MRGQVSRRQVAVTVSGLVIGAGLLAGCGSSGSSGGSGGGNSSGGKSSSASGSPIVVGVVVPYSGDSGYYGTWANDAWKLAESKYGSSIDGHPIKLVRADSKCEPTSAVSAVRQVLAQHPVAIMTSPCSGDTLALMPFTKTAKVPTVSENLAPSITTQGDPYVWRAQTSDAVTNQLFGKYIAAQGVKSPGIIHDTTAYGTANAATLVSGLKSAGVTPKADASYDFSATDYSGQILSLKKAGVDAAYLEGYDIQNAHLVNQAVQLGLNVPYYAPTTTSDNTFLKAAGKNATKVKFATSFLPTWSPAAKQYAAAWKAKFGSATNEDATGLYEIAVTIISALKKAGPTASSQEVNSAIAKTNIPNLPMGNLSFKSNGDNANPLVMVGTWTSNGTPKLIKVLSHTAH
jgi:branched-chain amino acid transport system substrate-binding protein